MLDSPVDRQALQFFFRDILERLDKLLPDGLAGYAWRGSAGLRLMALVRGVMGAIGMHMFLQPLQRFRNQGRNRLARLTGKCDKQACNRLAAGRVSKNLHGQGNRCPRQAARARQVPQGA